MRYDWDFTPLASYSLLWLHGVGVTFALSLLVICVGTALGGLLVLALRVQSRLFRVFTRLYVDIFRAIPALVLIGSLYFCLPILTGLRIDPFDTAFIALSLNLAPFAAECIRSGIESVPNLQYESTRVMGFSKWQSSYYVIAPQAVRRILPPLVGQYVTSLKLTSLAATISVPEIWHATGQVITATSLPIEARLVGAILYVAIILPFLWLSRWLEKQFNVRGFGQPILER